MYFADYHTHSRVSPDAFSSMTEMAEAAIRQGIEQKPQRHHLAERKSDTPRNMNQIGG